MVKLFNTSKMEGDAIIALMFLASHQFQKFQKLPSLKLTGNAPENRPKWPQKEMAPSISQEVGW